MNPAEILAAVLGLLPHLIAAEPSILKAAADIAHGKGGITKVQTVVDDLKAAVDAAAATP